MEISNRLSINKYKPVYSVCDVIRENNERCSYTSFPNCCPIYFSPSFTAMKKTEFIGVDGLVVEKFKAPIQVFKTKDEFDIWAEAGCQEILSRDYEGRNEETTAQRKSMINEWKTYLYEENGEYTPAQKLLILDGVTKVLKEHTDDVPPVLNRRVLADTILDLEEELKQKQNKKEYNFHKAYENNLIKFYSNDIEESTGTDMTGWVVIPSKEKDPEHFDENVEKLKVLSHKNWCTKSYNAKPYLEKGDFHVYLESGKPKIGLRFSLDRIREIQGEKNNGRIPDKYLDMVNEYIESNNLYVGYFASNHLSDAKRFREKYTSTIDIIRNAKSEDDVFKLLGIEVLSKDEDNLLTISHFSRPDKMKDDYVNYDDLGINLDKLLKNVKEIKGDADFSFLHINALPNLEKVGGNLECYESSIGDLGKLKEVGGKAEFKLAKVKDLRSLSEIGGEADFICSKIENLSGLTKLDVKSNFSGAKIGDLSGLTIISQDAEFGRAEINNLSGLTTIGGYANFGQAKIKDLSGLTTIGNGAWFAYSNIENLSALTTIGGNASFNEAVIGNLGRLTTINGDADFTKAEIPELPSLETIDGDADFTDAKIKNRRMLKKRFKNSKEEKTNIFKSIKSLITSFSEK